MREHSQVSLRSQPERNYADRGDLAYHFRRLMPVHFGMEISIKTRSDFNRSVLSTASHAFPASPQTSRPLTSVMSSQPLKLYLAASRYTSFTVFCSTHFVQPVIKIGVA
jgi:hypothetical protein